MSGYKDGLGSGPFIVKKDGHMLNDALGEKTPTPDKRNTNVDRKKEGAVTFISCKVGDPSLVDSSKEHRRHLMRQPDRTPTADIEVS